MHDLPPVIQRFEADASQQAEFGRTMARAWTAFADTIDPPEAVNLAAFMAEPGDAMAAAESPGEPITPEWRVRFHDGSHVPITDVVTADRHKEHDGWVRFWCAGFDEPVATSRADAVISIRERSTLGA